MRAQYPSAQLPMTGRGIVRRLCVAKTSDRGMQELPSFPRAGALLSFASEAQARLWAPAGHPCLPCSPLQRRRPCPSASWAGTEQGLGGNLTGTLSQA